MEIGTAPQEPPSREEEPYDDTRRKREILPPQEEWPVALRPALRGKVKILEDRPQTSHKVRLAVGRRRGSERKRRPSTQASIVGEGKGEAHTLMEQLTPLLEKWLRDNLLRLGIKGTGKGNSTPDPMVKPKTKGGKKTGTLNPPLPPNALGTHGAKRGKGATTAPNMELWNNATDTGIGDRAPPLPLMGPQPDAGGDRPTGGPTPTCPEPWTEVVKKGRGKRNDPSGTRIPPATREQREPKMQGQGGKPPAKTPETGKTGQALPPADASHRGQQR